MQKKILKPITSYNVDVVTCSECGSPLWRAYAHRIVNEDPVDDELIEVWHCHKCYHTFTTIHGTLKE